MEQTTLEQPGVQFVTRPHLLDDAQINLTMPEGRTLGEMLDASGIPVSLAPWTTVTIDGHTVPAEWWDRTRPKAGTTVTGVSGLPGVADSQVVDRMTRQPRVASLRVVSPRTADQIRARDARIAARREARGRPTLNQRKDL